MALVFIVVRGEDSSATKKGQDLHKLPLQS